MGNTINLNNGQIPHYPSFGNLPSIAVNGSLAITDGATPALYQYDAATVTWVPFGSGGATGTVTSVSVVSSNGLAGTVANQTTTPAITLSTTVTGILQGNGTAISAASTTGSGSVVLATSPTLVTPALGTPSALVGTNITGTAAGLTAGNVTTNANLTGPITSSGNATSIASQTGTGSTFAMSASPTFTGTLTAAAATLSGTLTMINSNVLSAKQITYNGEVDDGNSGTSKTIDWTQGSAHKIVMTGNCAFSFTNPSGPSRVQLKITQDATGSRTATWPTSAPKVFWPTVAPVLTPTASTGVDVIAFWFDGTNYYGVASQNFV